MKKLLRDLAAWTFRRCGGDDRTLAVLTAQTIGVTEVALDAKSPKAVNASLSQVWDNKEVRHLLTALQAAQRDYLAEKATPDTIWGARGTLNGINLVASHLKSAHDSHLAEMMRKADRPFDKHSPI